MNLSSLWAWLESSTLGSYVAASEVAFPMIESLHVIAIVTVVGTIAVMDMRLLGVTSRACSVLATSRNTLPLTWGAFVIAAITGGLLFTSKASTYAANPYFIAKMCFMALAGINMGILHLGAWKTVSAWDSNCEVPTNVKVAAGLSLFFWLLVVFCGRVIGFTLGIYE